MKRLLFGITFLCAALALTGCGGGGSTGSSIGGSTGGDGGGTTATPAAKGTALVTVDTVHNTATVKPLDPSSRAIFSGSAVALSTIKVNEDAGEVTARQLAVTVTNKTQGPLSNLRFTVSQVKPLTAPDTDDRANTTVNTFAGTGVPGTGSGSALSTPISGPFAEWVDTDGSVYVTSSTGACIRKIKNGEVSTVVTIAGTTPNGITGDSNFIFFSDYVHHVVYRVHKDGSNPTIIAGTLSTAGDADGAPGTSKLTNPVGLTLDKSGNLYIANAGTGVVREVANPDTATNCTKLATLSGSYSLADITLDGVEYLVDGQYSTVAKIALISLPGGVITTIVGTTSTAAQTGPANTVSFNLVKGLAVSGESILIGQSGRNQINILYRQPGAVATDPTAWVVGLIAGSGTSGSVDGKGTVATFNVLAGLAVNTDGSVLVGDVANNKVRRIVVSNFSAYNGVGNSPSTGSVSVGAPDTYVANADGNNYPAFVFTGQLPAGQSTILNPWAFDLSSGVTSFQFVVTVDGQTSFDAVLDAINHSSGAGSSQDYVRTLTSPSSLTNVLTGRLADVSTSSALNPCFAADGTAFVATDTRVLRVDTSGNVTIIAGNSNAGAADGIGQDSEFNHIRAITCSADGTIYVADNDAVRRIVGQGPLATSYTVSTVAGSNNSPGNTRGNGELAKFSVITGIGVSPNGQNIYVADSGNFKVCVLTLSNDNDPTIAFSWDVEDLAGTGANGFADGNSAQFGFLDGLAVTPLGAILVCDTSNHRIRKVTTGGVTSTLCGSGGVGFVDGPAGTAQLTPWVIAVGPSGYVYFSDSNIALRRVSPTGDVETIGTDAGTVIDGNLSAASLNQIYSLAVSPSGKVWYDSLNALRSVERIVGQ